MARFGTAALACAAGAVMLTPSTAGAASVTGGSGKHVFRAGGGEKNQLVVYRDKRDRYLFKDRRVPVKARGRCTGLDKRSSTRTARHLADSRPGVVRGPG